jgi:exodeoxyribonuclease-3
MGKGFMEFLNQNDFGLVGLQEIKMQPDQADFSFPGYHVFWHPAEKKGYSGTLALSRKEPLAVTHGIGAPEGDTEGRVLTLEFSHFYFVTVYTPNSKNELERLDYRMIWQDYFREHLTGLAGKKPVVVCGDLNVAHKEIDLKHPKTNTKNAGFTPQERTKMTELLDAGFTDTFRLLYPDQKDVYTWWTFIGNARARNVGWRIDYFLVSDGLKDKVREAEVYNRVLGSDHCPVGVTLEIAF